MFRSCFSFALAALAVTLSLCSSHGSTIVQSDPMAGGIGYRWTVTMAALDSATFQRRVGAWSWEDDSLFNAGAGQQPVGWTHTSDWVALKLDAPVIFTLRIERQAGVPDPVPGDPEHVAGTASMFPSFTIWSNWDNDGGDQDTYNNRGNVSWAEDLVYLDHVDNSTATFVERTWELPAGEYSIALGSNAPATDTERQGYRATLTTTPVPEPAAGMALMAAAALMSLRRRQPGRR